MMISPVPCDQRSTLKRGPHRLGKRLVDVGQLFLRLPVHIQSVAGVPRELWDNQQLEERVSPHREHAEGGHRVHHTPNEFGVAGLAGEFWEEAMALCRSGGILGGSYGAMPVGGNFEP